MNFHPPDDWIRLTTIDAHTAGEPLRIVTSGFPDPPGKTMLEKREYARAHLDPLRCALMLEPRGHADMYGCVPTSPVTADGDLGVLFLHNEGYSTMCGHGIIALVKVALESGWLEPRTNSIAIDTPAGRVSAMAHWKGTTVERVSFHNVPSFVLERNLLVRVTESSLSDPTIRCDIAFGGAFYAYVEGPLLGLEPRDVRRLIEVGTEIKRAVSEQYPIRHPSGAAELEFLYGVIFVWPKSTNNVHSQNVCIFAEGEVDRSPTGTGVSGRAAIHHARGELALGQVMTIESILGTTFDVSVVAETRVGALPAVIPEVTGSAHITGRHEFFLDPNDPLRSGFLLR